MEAPYHQRRGQNDCKRHKKEFIKVNFDGAAKGNPGEVGIGGLFRDDMGKTLRVYVMDYGNATNNEGELHALKRGLEIAIREQFQKLQVEGDSKMAIEMVKKLQQGTQWENINERWRTTCLVQEISKIIRKIYHPYTCSKKWETWQKTIWKIGDATR